jgi:peptide chain release factor 1
MNEFRNKLGEVLMKHEVLSQRLNDSENFDKAEFARLSKEFADLSDIVTEIKYLNQKEKELEEANLIISESSDVEMIKMAEEEICDIKREISECERRINLLLVSRDIDDDRGAILEVRAGTGGDEAGLFAADLCKMYELYSSQKGWKFDVLSLSENGIGSVKEACMSISGVGVYSRLKFESGVHRVQRVPETEASGRIHTSAATVAVLPEVEEVDVTIDEKDLKIDTYRASGAGGQHVNKTDSAVRITHIPTGIIVAQQTERSQHKNKAKALKILRSRIYEAEKVKTESSRSLDRKKQVGTGDRSERIRTYNFPQGRVTEHRINLTLYKIDRILDGSALDEIIDKLIEFDQIEKLKLELSS